MKDCFYQYRKGLYEALISIKYKGTALEVMEFTKKSNSPPYVQMLNFSSSPSGDDDKFSQYLTCDIMVVTQFSGEPGDFGSKESDDIMNLIMQELITMGVTASDRAKHITMDDFIDAGCYFIALNYVPEFDGAITTIRKILTIQTMIDEK